ncbi:MAG: MoaD/ThiS family protein [Desulfurococcaceae archaeon]
MTIRVKIVENNMVVEFAEQEMIIAEILNRLGLSSSEHVVLKNGSITVENDVARDGDEIVLFTVKSGG